MAKNSINAISFTATHSSLTPNITLAVPIADVTLSSLAEHIKLMREQSNQQLSLWVEGERNRGQIEGERDRGQTEGERDRRQIEGERNRGQTEGDNNRGQTEGERDRGQIEGERNRGQTDRKRRVSEGELSDGEENENDNLDADIDIILSAHIGNQAEETSKAKKIKN